VQMYRDVISVIKNPIGNENIGIDDSTTPHLQLHSFVGSVWVL
jgi:hypothetical protein